MRLPSRPALPAVLLAALSLLAANPARAQFFATCDTASQGELERSLSAYQEHNFRLAHKFLDGYYLQTELPDEFEHVSLAAIQAGLAAGASRRSGLLFHAYSGYAFCAWLITADGVVGAVTPIGGDDYESLALTLRAALGIAASEQSRSPRRRGVRPAQTAPANGGDPDELLVRLSDVLIPAPVRGALTDGGIDSLLVTPLASTATLPLAALPVDAERRLVDVASIALLADHGELTRSAVTRSRSMQPALIAGDPVADDEEWEFPPLPGARAEAAAVAHRLDTDALLGAAATREALTRRIGAEPSLALIYLATHGIASSSNPLDASFLLLADARWPAAEIQNLALEGRPLVVLSACQTGLGKDFDVGTMGMARAWARAGAAEVVMSLWNVDDDATRELMLEFIDAAAELPADRALRRAMLTRRSEDPDIAGWASFAVLGRPGVLAPAARQAPPAESHSVPADEAT
ncbi:MAG TPA: CHAT domain-containing protein [Woeseiaceae bacterium]|nr:CHAT domain-containing protein [Woeseiaceae bacterium]